MMLPCRGELRASLQRLFSSYMRVALLCLPCLSHSIIRQDRREDATRRVYACLRRAAISTCLQFILITKMGIASEMGPANIAVCVLLDILLPLCLHCRVTVSHVLPFASYCL